MRLLLFITCVALMAAAVGCASHRVDYRAMVAQIRNDHVSWDGNYTGLHVRAFGTAEQRVSAAGAPCRPFLIEALADDSRFVAAHVLLTQMERSFPISATEWNHLRVELLADGRVEIPGGQKQEIERLWTQK
ncbi:MAG: hypothetical protein ACXWDN_10985 [Limisphaerales bacterium]